MAVPMVDMKVVLRDVLKVATMDLHSVFARAIQTE